MVLCAVLLVSLVFSIEVVGTSNTQQDTGRGNIKTIVETSWD